MNNSKIAFNTNEAANLSAAEIMTGMFKHTDKESGILYIPAWPRDIEPDGRESFYKCKMNWNEADLAEAVQRYESLYEALEKISQVQPESCPDALPEDLKPIWHTYVRDFEAGKIDMEEIPDAAASTEEQERYKAYCQAVQAESEDRVGQNIAAYDLVIRAKRVYKLMSVKAPAAVIDHEAGLLAQAMAVHNYGISMEAVDDVE